MRMMRGFILPLAVAVVPILASAQTYPTNKDPRSTLKPGRYDAGIAISNMKQVSFVKKPAAFDTAAGLKFINSDLAFGTHYIYQANFAGFTIWDIADPANPVMVSATKCITSTCPAGRWHAPRPSSRDARTARTRPTRRTPSSCWTSSACRSTTRSRPR